MKPILFTFYFLLFTQFSFSQFFIPFGEDSVYNSYGSPGAVYTILIDDTISYIGGAAIHYAGSENIYQIGAFYNNEWHSMDNGFGSPSGIVKVVAKYQNQIYIGGNFNDIDDIPNTENIGRFNGTTWEALPNTYGCPNSKVYDMVVWDNKLIIGGSFNAIPSGGSYNMPYVVAYDGSDYIDINDGEVPFDVKALAVYNGELYACGWWYSLKKYIGNKHWEQVGGGLNSYGYDMLVDTFNNFLYVAGGFKIVDDSIPCDEVAFWDGYKWTGIGTGEGDINLVQDIGLYRGEIYTNRFNDTVGGVYTGKLAKWNGTSWEPGVPGGIKYWVNSLAVYNDELWIGGGAPNDGNNYCPFDTARKTLSRWYLPPTINCNYLQPRIQSHTDTFFVNQAVQIHNNNAYIDSWQWDFGDGGTATVQNPYHTYTDTGTYTVTLTVNWQSCQKTVQRNFVVVEGSTTNIKQINKESGFILYPNPTKSKLFVEIKDEKLKIENEAVQIIDINGKLVKTIVIANAVKQSVSNNEIATAPPRNDVQTIDISRLKKGVYFVKIGNQTERFVKE